MRSCIGCRTRCDPAELLRVVVVVGHGGVVAVPDPRRRLPGRGAWLHAVPHCFALAERRKAFGRALRVTSGIDLEPLRSYIDRQPPTQHTDGTPTTGVPDPPPTEGGFDADERPMSTQR